MNPIDKVQKAIFDLEKAYIDSIEIIGEKKIGSILGIPQELESFIKDRLRLKGIITNRHGAKWSNEEDRKLIIEIQNNKNITEIAKSHKRTEYAITKRIEKLNKERPI